MTSEVAIVQSTTLLLPPVPWRDPHTVSPAQHAEYNGERELADVPRHGVRHEL